MAFSKGKRIEDETTELKQSSKQFKFTMIKQIRQIEEKKEVVETEISVLRKNVNLFVAKERKKLLKALEKQMTEYADCLAFEEAAKVRDEINSIKQQYGD